MFRNRHLPGSKTPHCQNKAKCTTRLGKMSFIYMRLKIYSHIKGWTLSLVLIQSPGGTRKWPFISGIVGGDAAVSYWPFPSLLIILPELFSELNSSQFLVSSKGGELWWEVAATPRKTPVFTVKPSDENLLWIIIGLLYCIQPGENVVERRHRKWVIIGPNTDTTEKFLFHKGWSILR